jgi:cell division protease FtsH
MGSFESYTTDITLKNIAGLELEIQEVMDVINYLKNKEKYRSLGISLPKGMVFYGPPGTGKSLLAKAIAGEAGVPFYYISASDLVGDMESSSELKLSKIFKEAVNTSPSIIFFDEIDNFTRSRMELRMSGTETLLQELLVQMDGLGKSGNVLVIGSTNRLGFLDEALLRSGRFDRKIAFEKPNRTDRLKILYYYAKDKHFSSEIDFETLVDYTSGLTGADIESIMNDAGLLAIREDRDFITQVDFVEAITRNQMGMDRSKDRFTPEEIKRVATHEIGHAIASMIELPEDEIEVVSVSRRDRSLGHMKRRNKEKEVFASSTRLRKEMVILLAGMVSEEILYGDTIDGNSDDLRRANTIARLMVTRYAMSDLGGVRVYSGQLDETPISENQLARIDEAMNKILDEAHARTVMIIQEKRELIEYLSNYLAEEKTLSLGRLKELIEEFNLNQTNPYDEIHELQINKELNN